MLLRVRCCCDVAVGEMMLWVRCLRICFPTPLTPAPPCYSPTLLPSTPHSHVSPPTHPFLSPSCHSLSPKPSPLTLIPILVSHELHPVSPYLSPPHALTYPIHSPTHPLLSPYCVSLSPKPGLALILILVLSQLHPVSPYPNPPHALSHPHPHPHPTVTPFRPDLSFSP